MTVIPIFLLVFAWIFIIFGIIAVFRAKDLYVRILSSAMIETIASLTLLLALILISIVCATEEGLPFCYRYIIRFVMLIGFMLVTNPISAHVNIRSAYLTGMPVKNIGTDRRKGGSEDVSDTRRNHDD